MKGATKNSHETCPFFSSTSAFCDLFSTCSLCWRIGKPCSRCPSRSIRTLFPDHQGHDALSRRFRDVIARTVATPLEAGYNGVEGMEYVSSQSTGNGQLTITSSFKIGSNADNDLLLTQNARPEYALRACSGVQLQGVQVKKTNR